ncbi:transposase family protein [Phormidesmis priestleyi]
MFNFDRSCGHEWVHRLLPILEQALGDKQVLPVRKLSRLAEFVERFPEVKEGMVESTERPVQRPKDPERQKEQYSGKKKRHTRKHITASTGQKRVIILTKARPGKVHDKRQLANNSIVNHAPPQTRPHPTRGRLESVGDVFRLIYSYQSH